MTQPREFSIPDRRLGVPIVRMGTVSSTMDIARDLGRLGAAEGTTVVAARQSAGRGRAGRTWESPGGAGLYCSVLLRPRIDSSAFQPMSIAVGLAVCDALDPEHRLGLQVKWPNDVLADGRKLAGILIRTYVTGSLVESAVLGIGLNLVPDSTRPAQAISLADLAGFTPNLWGDPLSSITTAIQARYAALAAGDTERALEGWDRRLAYLGERVTIEDGASLISGLSMGLGESGSLLIETATGLISIVSGDLTRGPRLAPDE